MLDFLCIEKCRGCSAFIEFKRWQPQTSCADCWYPLTATPPNVELCAMSDAALPVVSASPYTGVLKKLVYKFKYDNDGLVGADMVSLLEIGWSVLYEMALRDLSVNSAGALRIMLIPVPLHWKRRWRRGFNQSSELAKMLRARILRAQSGSGGLLPEHTLQVVEGLLVRSRSTQAHHGLGRAERVANVHQAFEAKKTGRDMAPGESSTVTIVVDDIYTSGATLAECARVLRGAGFEHVYGLTVARAVDD
jgi:ComF family protein